jgi:hypothetical protein
MKSLPILIIPLLALALLSGSHRAVAQGTAFHYQGSISGSGLPLNGTYDFKFTLWDALTGGAAHGTVTVLGVTVSRGLFTVTLDYGAVFNGTSYWLEIQVKTPASPTYSTLTPRQALLPVPYAIYAEQAAGVVPGSITSAALAAGAVGNTALQPGAVNGANIAPGQVVKSLNSLYDNVTLVPGANVTITPGGGNTLTFAVNGVANDWQLTGNAGTTPGLNFLGTTDNQPLEFWVNSSRAFRLEPNTSGSPNVIGGSMVNFVAPGTVGAVIAGGGATNYFSGNVYSNSVASDFSSVGGGFGNTIQTNAIWSAISSGVYHTIQSGANASVIVGGELNTIESDTSTIGGGGDNSIEPAAGASIIGGGYYNRIQMNAYGSAIVGGGRNIIQTNAWISTIGGGAYNSILSNAFYSTIGGGYYNTVGLNADNSIISGGQSNTVQAGANFSTIGGGQNNSALGAISAIGGGQFNSATGVVSTVSGGAFNAAAGDYSFVGGGIGNSAVGYLATIAGGYQSAATNDFSTVGGGYENVAGGKYATVSGGFQCYATGPGAFIGGGGYDGDSFSRNYASGGAATVAGGFGNSAAQIYASIGGGHLNSTQAGSVAGTIGGGEHNTVTGVGLDGSIGGTIGGGEHNTVTGSGGTIPGGTLNVATIGAFAAGTSAQAVHDGAFVWSDDSSTVTSSTANNQFVARATGGFVFYTAPASAGAQLPTGATSWSAISDRNAKKNIANVNYQDVLDKLAQVPVQQWNYNWEHDGDTPNLGPMAQDFKHTFYPGRDDKSISTLEFDGVELAAILGLNQKLEERDRQLQLQVKGQAAQLEEQAVELKARETEIQSLQQRLARLEQMMSTLPEKH